MKRIISPFSHIDWILFLSTLPLLGASLVTMNSFTGDNHFFVRQVVWICLALVAFFVLSLIDYRFLRRSNVLIAFFLIITGLLIMLFSLGHISKGAESWFRLGLFSIQPSDPAKIVLIFILAKYFSRRHIEIARIRHLFISGLYSFVIFLLVLVQPDFGTAIIILCVWLGMVLVSGISKKHLLFVFIAGVISFALLWVYVFRDYQKDRIMTFIHPLADIRGAGYNANQSMIAVGSGKLLGKGIGYGTQSRLKFLPEYQTDFIFAAFAEEWGFVGALILIFLYGTIVVRVVINAMRGASNFEILYGAGLGVFFTTHFLVNVGMNVGLLPVTGVALPFLSYGGSHLITEFAALGVLMGMRKYQRPVHKTATANEIVGMA